jgi:hypothetical protein
LVFSFTILIVWQSHACARCTARLILSMFRCSCLILDETIVINHAHAHSPPPSDVLKVSTIRSCILPLFPCCLLQSLRHESKITLSSVAHVCMLPSPATLNHSRFSLLCEALFSRAHLATRDEELRLLALPSCRDLPRGATIVLAQMSLGQRVDLLTVIPPHPPPPVPLNHFPALHPVRSHGQLLSISPIDLHMQVLKTHIFL